MSGSVVSKALSDEADTGTGGITCALEYLRCENICFILLSAVTAKWTVNKLFWCSSDTLHEDFSPSVYLELWNWAQRESLTREQQDRFQSRDVLQSFTTM